MIKILENGEIDINSLEVKDIFDIDDLQHIQDQFSKLTGMTCHTVLFDGTSITEQSGRCEFCEMIQRNSSGRKQCFEEYQNIGGRVINTKDVIIEKCPNGLIEFGFPIVVEEKVIGIFAGGQVAENRLDVNDNIQSELGIDSVEYSQNLKIVEELKIDRIESGMDILKLVINQRAKASYERIRVENITSKLSNKFMQTSATI